MRLSPLLLLAACAGRTASPTAPGALGRCPGAPAEPALEALAPGDSLEDARIGGDGAPDLARALRPVEDAGYAVLAVTPIDAVDDGRPDLAALLVPRDALDADTDANDDVGIGFRQAWPAARLGVLACGSGGWALADEPTPLDEGYRYAFEDTDVARGPGGPTTSVVLWKYSFEAYAEGLVLGTATEALPVEEPATKVGVIGRLGYVGSDVALMDDHSSPLAASGWFPYGGDLLWVLAQLYVYDQPSWNVVPRLRIGPSGASSPDDETWPVWFLVGEGPAPAWCGERGVGCATFAADPAGRRPGVDWMAGAWADPAEAPAGLDAPGARWLWTGDRWEGELPRDPQGLVPLASLPRPRAVTQAPPPERAALPPAPRADAAPLALATALAGEVEVLAVAPDRRWAVTMGYDGAIDVWSPADGVLLRSLPPSIFRRAPVFGPGGLLAVTSLDGFELWDLIAGVRLAEVKTDGPPAVTFAGDRLLVGDRAELAWYDLKGARQGRFAALSEPAIDLAVAPDGAVAALGEAALRTWAPDGKARWEGPGPEGESWEATALWYDEGGDLLAQRGDRTTLWSPQGAVRRVDEDPVPRDLEGRPRYPIRTPEPSEVAAMAFADRARLVTVGGGALEVWDLDRLTHARIPLEGYAIDVAADATGASVLWTAGDGSIVGVRSIPAAILRLGQDTDVDPYETELWSGSPPGGSLLRDARLSPDRRLVAVWSSIYGDDPYLYPVATLLDASTGVEVGTLVTEVTVEDAATGGQVVRGVDEAEFAPDGAVLITINADDTASAWDTAALTEPWNLPAPEDAHVAFTDGATACVGDRLRDARTGAERGPCLPELGARSPDGALVAGPGIRVGRPGGPAVTLRSDVAGRWVAYTDDGWFEGSPEADRILFGVRGLDVLGLDQIAVERNRPDRVLEALGRGDPRLVAHLRARATARARRAGSAAGALAAQALPSVTIEAIAADEGGARLTLTAAASGGLGSVQVYVDGVAVHDGRGRPVEGASARVEERVALLAGDNLVEVSAFDLAGRESVRARASLAGPPEPRGDLWYLGIGVSDYANDALDLRYARKDAEDLALLFAAAGGFGEVHTLTLTDASATRPALAKARSWLAEARPEDTFVLFIAGHGVHDDDDAKTYYFLTHEADIARLPQTAAAFDEVEALLAGIAPRRKLWLMDTCESGEADEAAPEPLSRPGEVLAARAVRGTRVTRASEGATLRVHERDRYLYRDVQRRVGAVVLSSSRGGEYSYESAEIANGQFTEAVMAALTSAAADADGDGWLTPAELRASVAPAVATATNGRQNPTIDRDNPLQTVRLPLIPVAPPP